MRATSFLFLFSVLFVFFFFFCSVHTLATQQTQKYEISVPRAPECSDPRLLVEQLLDPETLKFDPLDQNEKHWRTSRESELHPELDFSLDTPEDLPEEQKVRRVPLSEMTEERFKNEFLEKEPVVFVEDTPELKDRNKLFRTITQRNVLLKCYGDYEINLRTSNQFSDVSFKALLKDYVDPTKYWKPQNLTASALEVAYHFGMNNFEEWDPFFNTYRRPTELLGRYQYETLAFGFSATLYGVSLHRHAHVFAQTLHGKKRWILAADKAADGTSPRYDGTKTVLRMLLDEMPTWTNTEKKMWRYQDCTLGPHEILYIPTLWRHATLNIGDTVYMSTFV